MLDKKHIWAIFLFEFKIGCKAAETTHNIKNALHLGTANKHIVQWRFKKFWTSTFKETWALKMRRAVAAHRNLTMTMGRIIEAHPLVTTWDTAEELNVSNSIVIQQLKQAGKVKELDKWVTHELTTKKKKNHYFEVLFFYYMQQQQIISWSDCDIQAKVDFT